MLAVPASSQAIVNGSPDAGAHPNVGALTEHFNGAQVLACTGTLISPTVLVTAAHCTAVIEQFGFTQTEVSFDTNIGSGSDITCGVETADCYVQPAANSLHVGTLHTNPAFNGLVTTGDSHDVAVVTFDKPIKGIAPASLPTAGLLDNMVSNGTFASQTFTNVGYGWHAVVSKSTGLVDGVRRHATSGSQSLSTSDLKLSENATLNFGGACQHDSGGPAFVGNGGVVAGEVSGLQSDCDATYFVYRLDTEPARSFLANYVALP
jgi:hypothetical protein